MRKLIASTFTSLDGVMQAPGGPTEDPTGNFTLGGWLFSFWDAAIDLSAAGFDGKDREVVLGRKTYEIFEAYWPYQPEDDPIAKTLNVAKKHVASRTLKSLQWNNSSVLGGDIVSAITALKVQPGHDLQIIGSGNLIQTLQAASLIDEYHIWTFPVVLGCGKRLFEHGARPCALRLVASKVSKTGVVMSTYVPSGDIPLGDKTMNNPTFSPLPLIPAIAVHDARQAIAFYQQAFGATELYRLIDPESGKIGHAELLLNGSMIMLADEYPAFNKTPQTLGGTTMKFVLMVDDVDASVDRASAAGAIVVRPPSDEFYGHRSATVRDPFGHEWMLQKEIEKVTPEEMQSRWDAMVKQTE